MTWISGCIDLIAHFAQASYDEPEQLPGARMSEPNFTVMVETFALQITAAVEASLANRVQAAIAGAFGVPQERGPGRPAKLGRGDRLGV